MVEPGVSWFLNGGRRTLFVLQRGTLNGLTGNGLTLNGLTENGLTPIMDNNYAVYVNNLSKVYRFYKKPVDRLLEAILRKSMHTAFSALEQISFCLAPGTTLGIIGENGAGKSTLLKILARTLNPSSGMISMNGRIAALLELGAGFHHEFTGRQNIFLNASLLGLSEVDIKEKEDEIIGFSELNEFIDRPLKTYSSGMVVRLAFSIATCVDPDILIIDEALSVGDIRFQQKCIDRMIKFRESGKTLVFCSHSMYQINELCSEALWLKGGRLKNYGDTSRIVSEFMNYLDAKGNSGIVNDSENATDYREHFVEAVVQSVLVSNEDGSPIETICELQDIFVNLEVKAFQKDFQGHVGVAIFDAQDQMVFGTTTKHSNYQCLIMNNVQSFEVKIKNIPLKRGKYVFKGYVLDKECLRVIDEKSSNEYQTISRRPDLGYLNIAHEWNYKIFAKH